MAGFAIVWLAATMMNAIAAAHTAQVVIIFRIADLLIYSAETSGISQMTSGMLRTVSDQNDDEKRCSAACDAVQQPVSTAIM
jgi:hypothetical protein